MNVIAALYLIMSTAAVAARESNSGELTVIAKVRPGQVHVGQVLEITLGIVGNQERPKVKLPAIEGAEIALVNMELRPISTSAIGTQIFGQNLYRFRYRLVPRRAGTLIVPPFVATIAENSGASSPLKVNVRALPSAGRPSDFLGGVGTFEIDATAEPNSVRLGRSFEYRITVRGPGAAGIHEAPSLTRLEKLPLKLEIEKKSDVVDADIPSHTFVYRLRATHSGEATLPPVPISAFDPEIQRYVTQVARGVPIRVTDVPSFDVSKFNDTEPLSLNPAAPPFGRLPFVNGVSTVALLAAAAALVLARRKHMRGNVFRETLRIPIERIRSAGESRDLAAAITEGLVAFLSRAIDRQAGALTPEEAEEGVARATGSAEMGRAAREVVEDCDAALYGGSPPAPVTLRTRALELFNRLAAANWRQPT